MTFCNQNHNITSDKIGA